jgi:DNA modification methylase
MCGDSTNANDVKKLMGEKLADMVFTDPPYNVAHTVKKKQGKFHTEKRNKFSVTTRVRRRSKCFT